MSDFVKDVTAGKFIELSIFLNQPDSLSGGILLNGNYPGDVEYLQSVENLKHNLPNILDREIASFEKKLKREYFLDYPDNQLTPIGILLTFGDQLVHYLSDETSDDMNDVNFGKIFYDRNDALNEAFELVEKIPYLSCDLKMQIFRACLYAEGDSWPRVNEFELFNKLGARLQLEIYISNENKISYQCWEDGEMSQEGYANDRDEYTFRPHEKALAKLLSSLKFKN